MTATNAGLTQRAWGEAEGGACSLYTLRNRAGMVARVSDFGATLVALELPPDAHADSGVDVVLGLDGLAGPDGYAGTQPFLGAVIGRVANRIGGAAFELAGRRVTLPANDGPNHLHGGPGGFHHRLWAAQPLPSADAPALALSYLSEDGEGGYPGRVWAGAVYRLGPGRALSLEFRAVTDALTPVSLTQHAYFNLAGHASGDVLEHRLTVFAERYTPTDDALIPTGEVLDVAGTVFDFRAGRALGEAVASGALPGGYDINMLVAGRSGELRPAARLEHPASGRRLELWTTQPALQVYGGGQLDGSLVGKGEARYARFAGAALEAQAIPNAVNLPHLPQVWLRPGEVYRERIEYRFPTTP
ncbi:MAG: galactose mutarotase [Deinococcales bacterium]